MYESDFAIRYVVVPLGTYLRPSSRASQILLYLAGAPLPKAVLIFILFVVPYLFVFAEFDPPRRSSFSSLGLLLLPS